MLGQLLLGFARGYSRGMGDGGLMCIFGAAKAVVSPLGSHTQNRLSQYVATTWTILT